MCVAYICVSSIQLFSEISFDIHTHLLNLAISIPFSDIWENIRRIHH